MLKVSEWMRPTNDVIFMQNKHHPCVGNGQKHTLTEFQPEFKILSSDPLDDDVIMVLKAAR